jgi:putative NIF3 family GTP cyclohydrolase 1 type 2
MRFHLFIFIDMKMEEQYSRRKFITATVTTLAAGALVITDKADAKGLRPQEPLTIREVIELIKGSIPMPQGITLETVDTVKAGNPDQAVTGIVSTMFATVNVIRRAIELKANLIIAHEPTFYNHLDQTDWLEQSRVYQYKRELIEKNNIVVWRFHDYWHTHKPDGVLMGVVTKLGWEKYYNESNPRILELEPTRLKDIISLCKKKLGIEKLRYVGDLSHSCKKVLLMPGASGGRNQIAMLQQFDPDLIICGEVAEWETSEYIRDARSMGLQRSLVVLGHAVSEEPGMEWLVNWLTPKVPGVKITHVPANNPFSFM